MSVANLSSNQGQSSQDKKNQSPHTHPRSLLKHRPAQSSNASEAGTSNQQKSLDDAVVFADDPEGDSVGVDSVEDNPGRQEDVDTAMEEEEDYGNDDKSDDYVLGDDDPLSIDDKSDDNESGGDDPLSRGQLNRQSFAEGIFIERLKVKRPEDATRDLFFSCRSKKLTNLIAIALEENS